MPTNNSWNTFQFTIETPVVWKWIESVLPDVKTQIESRVANLLDSKTKSAKQDTKVLEKQSIEPIESKPRHFLNNKNAFCISTLQGLEKLYWPGGEAENETEYKKCLAITYCPDYIKIWGVKIWYINEWAIEDKGRGILHDDNHGRIDTLFTLKAGKEKFWGTLPSSEQLKTIIDALPGWHKHIEILLNISQTNMAYLRHWWLFDSKYGITLAPRIQLLTTDWGYYVDDSGYLISDTSSKEWAYSVRALVTEGYTEDDKKVF
jgi:hypothetical protein